MSDLESNYSTSFIAFISFIFHNTSTVDFVLRDPRERDDDKQEEVLPHRAELSVVPKPWNKSFVGAQSVIIQELDITNPTMLQVLELWHVSFG